MFFSKFKKQKNILIDASLTADCEGNNKIITPSQGKKLANWNRLEAWIEWSETKWQFSLKLREFELPKVSRQTGAAAVWSWWVKGSMSDFPKLLPSPWLHGVWLYDPGVFSKCLCTFITLLCVSLSRLRLHNQTVGEMVIFICRDNTHLWLWDCWTRPGFSVYDSDWGSENLSLCETTGKWSKSDAPHCWDFA